MNKIWLHCPQPHPHPQCMTRRPGYGNVCCFFVNFLQSVLICIDLHGWFSAEQWVYKSSHSNSLNQEISWNLTTWYLWICCFCKNWKLTKHPLLYPVEAIRNAGYSVRMSYKVCVDMYACWGQLSWIEVSVCNTLGWYTLYNEVSEGGRERGKEGGREGGDEGLEERKGRKEGRRRERKEGGHSDQCTNTAHKWNLLSQVSSRWIAIAYFKSKISAIFT